MEIALDRRAPFTLEDRKAHFLAAQRVAALFERMSGLVDRIEAAGAGASARRSALPSGDALAASLANLAAGLEGLRGRVVATQDGGAVTGEQRLREHADILYGALLSWEGRPARTLVERTDALERELLDVAGAVDRLLAAAVPPIDQALAARGLPAVPTTPAPAAAARVSSAELRAGFAAFDGVVIRKLGRQR
jgi:hypothetical protein